MRTNISSRANENILKANGYKAMSFGTFKQKASEVIQERVQEMIESGSIQNHVWIVWDAKRESDGHTLIGRNIESMIDSVVNHLLEVNGEPKPARLVHNRYSNAILEDINRLESNAGPKPEVYISTVQALEIELRDRKIAAMQMYLEHYGVEVNPGDDVTQLYEEVTTRQAAGLPPTEAEDISPR